MLLIQKAALAAAVCSVVVLTTAAQAAQPYHPCKKALSYEVSLQTNLQCSYAKLLVEDVAQQVASRWPVKVFYLWDHGTNIAGHPRQYRYTCHASQSSQPGPGGDTTEVQRFRCTKADRQGFRLVTEIE
jgi:hypothetical protein